MGLWIILAVVVIGLIAIVIYNRLVGLRQNCNQGQGQSGALARLSLRLLSKLATVVMVRMVRMAVSD